MIFNIIPTTQPFSQTKNVSTNLLCSKIDQEGMTPTNKASGMRVRKFNKEFFSPSPPPNM